MADTPRRIYSGTCTVVLMGAVREGHGAQLRELVTLARTIGLRVQVVQHLEPHENPPPADPIAVVEAPGS